MQTLIQNEDSQLENYERLEEAYSLLYNEQSKINSGLEYARLIQQGILPKERHISRLFKDYFVIHKQRDIIGGDFYWVGQRNDLIFISVGDCAGHGVPGALLSMLGQSLLNYYVLGKGLTDPSEILEELDGRLEETFKPSDSEAFTHDWICMSICCINKSLNRMMFAGAGHSFFYRCKNDEIKLVRGNKSPLGLRHGHANSYSTFNIDLSEIKEGYMFTDGIYDQFGGPSNKKLTRKGLQNCLEKLKGENLSAKGKQLQLKLMSWIGDNDQTDDLTIVGFSI